jgi:phosphatidate cytidylyltransferase
MLTQIGPLFVRVVSAVTAAGIVLAVGYFGGPLGLAGISTFTIVLGVIEFTRMAFAKSKAPPALGWLFAFSCFVLYGAVLKWPEFGLLSFALTTGFFFSFTLWLTRNILANEQLLPALGMSSLGMIYCVCLPAFAVKTILLPQGDLWFLFLLLVIFAGDTFAYFGGRFFGRRKLMPEISPNKTIEGAIAGLTGSCVVGLIFIYFIFPDVPLWRVSLFSVACGFIGQSGDLLMSLVKRVAKVKDSGGIMPGHGGILDRLDGIFLAAPLVYAFAIS